MDTAKLTPVLDELDTHGCWIKPIGWSKQPIDADSDFGSAVIRLDFARRLTSLQMDDLLFVYAVGHRTLCFIGHCNTPVREASPADIEARPERTRWRHWVNAINLTPTFGR